MDNRVCVNCRVRHTLAPTCKLDTVACLDHYVTKTQVKDRHADAPSITTMATLSYKRVYMCYSSWIMRVLDQGGRDVV